MAQEGYISCPGCGQLFKRDGSEDGLIRMHVCEQFGQAVECECSEEYGPCEAHGDMIAQREGASTRTADDLVYVFLTDVLAIGESRGWLAPNMLGKVNADKLRARVDYWGNDDLWTDNHGCRWVIESDNDLADYRDALYEDQTYAESVLADLGLSVWWEDGYVISRVTGGPLMD